MALDKKTLVENTMKQHFFDYKYFLYYTHINTLSEELNSSYGRTTTKYVKNTYGKISWGELTDEDIAQSIEEFYAIMSSQEGADAYFQSLLNFAENATTNGTEDEFKCIVNEEDCVKIIAKHFKKLGGIKAEPAKNGKDEDGNPEPNYNDWINFIWDLIKEKEEKEHYAKIAYFLHICRQLRNKTDHNNIGEVFELTDAYTICRFKLYTLMATVLALRKSLHNIIPSYIFEPMELQVIHPKNITVKLTHVDDGKEISIDKSSEGEENNRTVFTIERYKKYRLTANEEHMTDFTCEWNSRTPTIIVKEDGSMEYKHDESALVSTDREGTFRHTMDRCDTIIRILEKTGKDVSSIDETTRDLLAQVKNLIKQLTGGQMQTKESFDQLLNSNKEMRGQVEKVVTLMQQSQEKKNQDNQKREDDLIELKDFLKNLLLQQQTSDERFKVFLEDFIQRQNERENDIINIATVEKENNILLKKILKAWNSNKWIQWSIICILLLMFMGIVTLMIGTENIITIFSPAPTPEELIEKGKQLYKQSIAKQQWEKEDFKEVGNIWREAMQSYREGLEKDPNNDSIHTALAMMFMRGMGEFNLDSALYHAQQAKTSRGKGLTAYLNYQLGEWEKARDFIAKSPNPSNDTYMDLTKTLLDMYGANDSMALERKEWRMTKAIQHLEELAMKNQDAGFDFAEMKLNGVEDNNGDYYVLPDVGFGIKLLDFLAADSISPIAIAQLSDCLNNVGDYDRSVNIGAMALFLGVSDMATILRTFIIQRGDELSINKQVFLDELMAFEQENSWVNKLSDLAQIVQNGTEYLDKAIPLADELVNDIRNNSTKSMVYTNLDDMKRNQIILRLVYGDSIGATRLAIQKDGCNDTAAVSLYMQGIMYAKGYKVPQDSAKSDSFIHLSALRGYEPAIYTNLRRIKPLIKKYIEPSSTEQGFVEIIETIKDGNVISDTVAVDPPHIFIPSANYVKVPDSVYQHNPLIAIALNQYWQQSDKRYAIHYCPIEYLTVINYLDSYEPVLKNKSRRVLTTDEKCALFTDVHKSIAAAFHKGQPRLFYQLCHIWVELAKELREEDPDLEWNLNLFPAHIHDYEQLIDGKEFYTESVDWDYPIYLY